MEKELRPALEGRRASPPGAGTAVAVAVVMVLWLATLVYGATTLGRWLAVLAAG
jgi:hypothetical protein